MSKKESSFSSQEAAALFTRRSLILGGGKLILTSLLVGRLSYLGLVRSSHYKTLADGNRIKLQILLSQRGLIIDRYGHEIANNLIDYRLILHPPFDSTLKKKLIEIQQKVNLGSQSLEAIWLDIHKQSKFIPYILKDRLTWKEVCSLQVNRSDNDGIDIEKANKRNYPFSYECAHIVGFVQAPTDRDSVPKELIHHPDYRMGRTGLEKKFDVSLQGKIGFREVEVNAYRQTVRKLDKVESIKGSKLHLSLNLVLQKKAYERMKDIQSGAAVVMNVITGEVLVCISIPSFNNNFFVNGIGHEAWNQLNQSLYTPLNNKVIQGTYPPGSIFKLVVALAALEAGIPSTFKINCRGFIEVGSHRFHCVHREGHGTVDFIKAIQVSCDTFFYELGRRVGIDLIAQMAIKLGLGDITGIELPHEKGGRIATRKWKKEYTGQGWTVGDTIISSIGQGSMLSTPLQMMLILARLATGKKVNPTLLYHESSSFPDQERLLVSQPSLEILRKGLIAAVNEPGGSSYLSRIEDESKAMAGKTATSQVRRITHLERATRVLKNEEIEWKRRDHSIFAGYAPFHKPLYAICVLVEHGGGGGRVAAPIARDILWETQKEHSYTS